MNNNPSAKTPASAPCVEDSKPVEVVNLDAVRQRRQHEAKKRAFWAGRNLAARHSARKAA